MEWLDPDRAANIVDQNINAPVGIENFCHQALRADERAQVDNYFHRFDIMRAQCRYGFSRAGVDAIGDHDRSALLTQPLGCGPADALAGAGNDADLVFQPAGPGCSGVQVFRHAFLLMTLLHLAEEFSSVRGRA